MTTTPNKVWLQLLHEGIRAARCTVERLMKKLGIQGVRRGKKCWTTIADNLLDRPTDKVNRQFVANHPNQLWVADSTFVATWTEFVTVSAFITDVFAQRIVGWLNLSLLTQSTYYNFLNARVTFHLSSFLRLSNKHCSRQPGYFLVAVSVDLSPPILHERHLF